MADPAYLVHSKNGLIFAYTPTLGARADMIESQDLDEAKGFAAKRGGAVQKQKAPEQPDDSDFVISKASKDELEAFAIAEYGKTLDKRRSLEDLRAQVAEMADAG